MRVRANGMVIEGSLFFDLGSKGVIFKSSSPNKPSRKYPWRILNEQNLLEGFCSMAQAKLVMRTDQMEVYRFSAQESELLDWFDLNTPMIASM